MSTYELIGVAVALRIFSAVQDGWSTRRVKWLPWHIAGWLCRDAIIIWIVWRLLGAPWESLNRFGDWTIIAMLNLLFHWVFYLVGERTIKFFPQSSK